MKILLDTNVLLRLASASHPMHADAKSAIQKLGAAGHQLVLVPQVIYEYWVVATRPAAQNGLGLTVAEARVGVAECTSTFPLLRDERGIFSIWHDLVVQASVSGKSAHDARLVAAMLRHGLHTILTFNKPDFARYSAIAVQAPSDV